MTSAVYPRLITGPRVVLQAVTDAHTPALRRIREHPQVHEWWGEVASEFPFDEDARTPGFAITVAGRVIGFVQYSEEDDAMYRHAGIDIFLDPEYHHRGLGRETVQTIAAHLIDERGHHRLVIDPCVRNERAIASYRSVGFQPVGVMRRYERSPSGGWRDGLLMDLLAEELVRTEWVRKRA